MEAVITAREKLSAPVGAGAPNLPMDVVIVQDLLNRVRGAAPLTGLKLADFIAGPNCDYMNARRIINGLDAADEIAANAGTFERMLRLEMV